MNYQTKAMSIKQAKEEVKNAVIAYSAKNEYGEYKIPIERQRPLFLVGPPGVGKTAIMEQVAAELGIGLVSYSMTHHTRQSALGLPLIVKRNFGGTVYDISEYTMSEIIAAVYKKIEKSGFKEGILFLDEINCVSETLAAPMLHFFQKKEFGGHQVPPGWVVVTAGNPGGPYNKSVREFDVVTLDRLKKIVISEDFDAWKEYADENKVHQSVITYLKLHKEDFYVIELAGDDKHIVTARAWTDLSDMIKLYEEKNIPVTKSLVEQYLQKDEIAKKFTDYYDLYNNYKSDYQIDSILEGKFDDGIKARAKNAKLGERISLVGLLMAGLADPVMDVYYLRLGIMELTSEYRTVKTQAMLSGISIKEALKQEIEAVGTHLEKSIIASSISDDDKRKLRYVLSVLDEESSELEKHGTGDMHADFDLLRADYKSRKEELLAKADLALGYINNAIKFISSVYGKEQPTVMLTTELATNKFTSIFLADFKSDNFLKYVDELKLSNRKLIIDGIIEKLKI